METLLCQNVVGAGGEVWFDLVRLDSGQGSL